MNIKFVGIVASDGSKAYVELPRDVLRLVLRLGRGEFL